LIDEPINMNTMEPMRCYVIVRVDSCDIYDDYTVVVDVYTDEVRAKYACAVLRDRDSAMKERSYSIHESLLHTQGQ
jgi:hypothetical protein